MIKNISDIKFPSVGGDRKYQVLCNGNVFAGYDTIGEAQNVMAMYSTPQKQKMSKGATNFNAAQSWTISISD